MKRRILALAVCLFLVAALLPVTAMAHSCVDADRDYWCDTCGMYISHKCVDRDKDGWCDYCSCWIIHTCADKDGDHKCDQCSKLMNVNIYVTAYSKALPEYEVQMIFYENATWSTVAYKTGSPATHIFSNPANKYFQLIISKYGHPSVTISQNTYLSDIYIEVELYPYGDASQDGRVNIGDTAKLYAHVKGTELLNQSNSYLMECVDVNHNGTVNIGDVAQVYSHVKGTTSLY